MKRIFTCNNHLELQAFKEALNRVGIQHFVKNEYIFGAVGELPFTEAWPELWVVNEDQLEQAQQTCRETEQAMRADKPEWLCRHCGETNDGSFEFCWQCEHIVQNG
ncbi:DUF2007 domain-containing protein [Psychrosphaera ytuae]|uniref:DUF2007 domain-containing protein n=1 Tax=Psychrosphaera ytuae TaxID=2820710 RepID=A0A975DC23_9GAMM|nr:DUF2007 domain-containing protein [Psychrosphaera ytuae]QTH64118.1 DUF2007 domain-containing protein [Psychrosphaera ytuae]